jgi:hypothetical protein
MQPTGTRPLRIVRRPASAAAEVSYHPVVRGRWRWPYKNRDHQLDHRRGILICRCCTQGPSEESQTQPGNKSLASQEIALAGGHLEGNLAMRGRTVDTTPVVLTARQTAGD